MFKFNGLDKELDRIHPTDLSRDHQQQDWANEMMLNSHQTPHLPDVRLNRKFEASFNAAMLPGHLIATEMNDNAFCSEFLMQKDRQSVIEVAPELSREFDDAFERAKLSTGSWESQFTDAQPSRNESWDTLFQNIVDGKDTAPQSESVAINAETNEDAIAQTADQLLDIVSQSSNPKFKQSEFVRFIQQLRDKDLIIEGNKLIQPVDPVGSVNNHSAKSPLDWANEFVANNAPTGSNIKQMRSGNWEEEFTNIAQPAASLWSNELAASRSLNNAQPADWTNEFNSIDAYNNDVGLDIDAQREKQLYQADFSEQFHQQASGAQEVSLKPLEEKWDEIQQGEASLNDLYNRNADNTLSEYTFTQNNPYLDKLHSTKFLVDVSQHNSLAESILALEAALQREGDNPDVWSLLGQKQQENENDMLAIAALRRAVEIDPDHLNSWLALSSSYTNENYTDDAYEALDTWVRRNPLYRQMNRINTTDLSSVLSSSQKHALVVQKFISAATNTPGKDLDADVQIALGVLYNISLEYEKAIDCFEAALSKRPNDFILWNKLGATIANSGNHLKAMDAYFNALQINPSFIRSRYNMAISCIQIGQFREAAEHLLGALTVQNTNLDHVMDASGGSEPVSLGHFNSAQSRSVWSALRLLVDSYSKVFGF